MMDNKSIIRIIANIVLFIFFLGLIIWAQKTVSLVNLGIEIVGLIGLLTMLMLYNKRHK